MSEHPSTCLHEQDWGKLWEIVKSHNDHVTEGDQSGGFRDRLLRAEMDIKILRERFWYSSLIGGVIGALIGSGSKDILIMFINWLMKK